LNNQTSSHLQLYVFIGPPGAGKGSLSQKCINEFGWDQLSTGFLCRQHISRGTEIGQHIDFAIKSGKLISDSLITQMVEEWLSTKISAIDGVILDGFPRTLDQAQALHTLLEKKFQNCQLHIIRLELDDEVIVNRLSARLVCQDKNCQQVYSSLKGSSLKPKVNMQCDLCEGPLGRRHDDEPETVRKRLSTYYEHEKPLVDFYSQQGTPMINMKVDKSLNEILDEFKKLVNVSK